MTMKDLLAKIGRGEIDCSYQFIFETITNARLSGKRGHEVTALTFLTKDTNPTEIMRNSGAVGVVVWIPRAVYDEAVKS